ncbi:glycosidase [candidate division KSB1 bacterium]|nr:glycosidase [candidate division KSB1 bacterium]
MIEFATPDNIIERYEGNPILSAEDIPYHSTLVFNAGVTKFNGKYVMMFRNDYGNEDRLQLEGTNLGLAFSDNGIDWRVQPNPCLDLHDDDIICVNDPRLTVIDGKVFVTVAAITLHGVRGAILVTDDFDQFETLSISVPDNRNMVLFPQKFNDKYLRLERPFSWYKGGDERFDIWISDSPDLNYWGNSRLFLSTAEVPYANNRIGAGPPPVKTSKGWLLIFHAVYRYIDRVFNGWEGNWNKQYMAGVMLLDLHDPSKILGYSKEPLLVPEKKYDYEVNGFRGNVVFPGGLILEDSGEVKIYYGAADTVEALAITHIDDLINFCSVF